MKKIETRILCSVTFFYFENMTIWRMRIACWIPKATNTHAEYVILTAFPWQQWLRERASLLLALVWSIATPHLSFCGI